jgi:hypothetical protein
MSGMRCEIRRFGLGPVAVIEDEGTILYSILTLLGRSAACR